MSFWELPGFIRLLEESGFSTQRHRLHFNVLLARPFLFCAMVLVGATFSLRMQRRGGAILLRGERRRRRLAPVLPLRHRLRARSLRHDPGRACGLGPGRRVPPHRRFAPPSSRRWLRVCASPRRRFWSRWPGLRPPPPRASAMARRSSPSFSSPTSCGSTRSWAWSSPRETSRSPRASAASSPTPSPTTRSSTSSPPQATSASSSRRGRFSPAATSS